MTRFRMLDPPQIKRFSYVVILVITMSDSGNSESDTIPDDIVTLEQDNDV
jgi:hypothetical protein